MKVIILPGWKHNHTHWQAVTEKLVAQEIEYEFIDLPGFGVEPFDASIKNLNDVTDWTYKRISQIIGNEKIILLGHSFGGRIGLSLGTYTTLPIEHLILLGSPNLYRPRTIVRVMKIITYTLKPFIGIVPERIRTHFRSTDYQNVRDSQLQELFTNSVTYDQIDALKLCQTPTSVWCGDKDTAVSAKTAREVSTLLANAELILLKGIGHNVHLENPTLLTGLIAKHVTT